MKKHLNHTRNNVETLRAEVYQLIKENAQQIRENAQLIRENAQLERVAAQELRESIEKSNHELRESIGKSNHELKEFFKESNLELKEFFKESNRDTAEFLKKSNQELRESIEKSNQELKEFFKESRQESDKSLEKLNHYLGGIAHSNGEMAEEYFYSAFKADATFANEKFDEVERNMAFKGIGKSKKAEFDLVLLNGKSAALIEVKYNAKPENISIEKIISRVKLFKILAPECEGYDIYLGVAAMSFKEGLETKLHQAGIATIRPVGEKMVVFDQSVKVF